MTAKELAEKLANVPPQVEVRIAHFEDGEVLIDSPLRKVWMGTEVKDAPPSVAFVLLS
jgi:hypothetical protein